MSSTGKIDGVRRDHNRDCAIIWLTFYANADDVDTYSAAARPESSRLDGEAKAFVKKRGGSEEANLFLLDRLARPETVESFRRLEAAVESFAQTARPSGTPDAAMYGVLRIVYLGSTPDIGAPERWRRAARTHASDAECVDKHTGLLEMLDGAIDRIVDGIGDHLLDVPSPIPAYSMTATESHDRRRRIARMVFARELERTGDPTLARRRAADQSGRSLRQVQRDTKGVEG